MNTVIANAAERYLGDRHSVTSTQYKASETETMRALRWYGNKDVRVETVPKPLITESKDAIVKVTGTTVCGSDLQ